MLKKISLFLLFGVGVVLAANTATQTVRFQVSRVLSISCGGAIDAVKCAFKALNLEFENATSDRDATRVKGKCTDGRPVHVEISKTSDSQCNIDVFVETSKAGKKDAQAILNAIAQCASNPF